MELKIAQRRIYITAKVTNREIKLLDVPFKTIRQE